MRRWVSHSEHETEAIGRELGVELENDGVLLLSGDLGAGKTVLVRGVAAALGIDVAEVQSPTFTLMRQHQGKQGSLLHVDLYRLESEDVPDIGLEEALYAPGVKVVEWAQRLPFSVPGALWVDIRRTHEPGSRSIEEREHQIGDEEAR